MTCVHISWRHYRHARRDSDDVILVCHIPPIEGAICCLVFGTKAGGVTDSCAVCKNIAYYRMRHPAECSRNMAVEVDGPLPVAYNIPCFQNMGFIGDQFAYRVAEDLNKYYTQFPCMGTPK